MKRALLVNEGDGLCATSRYTAAFPSLTALNSSTNRSMVISLERGDIAGQQVLRLG